MQRICPQCKGTKHYGTDFFGGRGVCNLCRGRGYVTGKRPWKRGVPRRRHKTKARVPEWLKKQREGC